MDDDTKGPPMELPKSFSLIVEARSTLWFVTSGDPKLKGLFVAKRTPMEALQEAVEIAIPALLEAQQEKLLGTLT